MKKYGPWFFDNFFREIFVVRCLRVSVDESLFEKYGSRTEWKMQVWVFASPAAASLPALPLPGWGMGWSYGRRKKKVGEIIPTGQETGRKLIDFWLHPCSVPQRKQANEQTKAWGSHRHIICLMAGLIDSKILVFLFQKSWRGIALLCFSYFPLWNLLCNTADRYKYQDLQNKSAE